MAGHTAQEPPPNFNAFRSWLAVFGSSLALFCTVGFLNAFGVFQEYYITYLPGKTDSDISWIGSMTIFLLYIGALVAGVLSDKLGPTLLLWTGSAGLLLSLFMTSLCTQYYQLFLAQAILQGISMSFIFCPALAVVSRRLPHQRGLALGLTIGGSSIGGVIWPIMLEQLLYVRNISFGWTLRAVAFMMIPLLVIACVTVVDPPVSPPNPEAQPSSSLSNSDVEEGSKTSPIIEKKSASKKKTDLSLLKNWTFLLLCAGLATVYLGLFTPFFYVSSYAIDQGMSSSTAFYLISAVNASSFFGRVIPGYLADRYGHFNFCTISVFAAGIVGFCWTATNNLAGLVIWCLAYGFASGAVMSLQGACAGKVASRESQGTALGLLQAMLSITSLVGTPISGQILLRGGYLGLGLWTGATLMAGAVILLVARLRLNSQILAIH
ncbi:major facilitator superfamily transporter [Xylariales sp. PMI_506]|nr:major facilitator superfamily transporter [Xylariales sp. PMI_506]